MTRRNKKGRFPGRTKVRGPNASSVRTPRAPDPGAPRVPVPPSPSPPLPARSLYDEKAREVSAGHRESPRGAAGALQDAGVGAGGRGAGPRSELPRETRMVSSFPLLSGRLHEDWRPRPRLSPRRDEDTARESPVWTRSRRGSRPAVSLPRR